jgi:hypothetical protein
MPGVLPVPSTSLKHLGIHTSLLRTCRPVYDEAAPRLYTHFIFHLTSPRSARAFIATIGELGRHSVRHVTFKALCDGFFWNPPFKNDEPAAIDYGIDRLLNLKRVEVRCLYLDKPCDSQKRFQPKEIDTLVGAEARFWKQLKPLKSMSASTIRLEMLQGSRILTKRIMEPDMDDEWQLFSANMDEHLVAWREQYGSGGRSTDIKYEVVDFKDPTADDS